MPRYLVKSDLFLYSMDKIPTNILLHNLTVRNIYDAYSVPDVSSDPPRHREYRGRGGLEMTGKIR